MLTCAPPDPPDRASNPRGQGGEAPGEGGVKTLEPGSYFGSKGKPVHGLACEEAPDCILYIRANGA